ncbi:MAG: Hsp33 family molecular chaperone HslO [Sphingomonadaceae bacterium]
MIDMDETYSDKVLGFTVPSRHTRGRVVRLDRVVDEILSAHQYPRPVKSLLAEALVLTALTGSLLKGEGDQLTMQAQTEGGIVKLLVCDYRDGELRGYVDFDAGRLAGVGANPSLYSLFGKGYLALTFDVAANEGRYQGVVPLEGESLSDACETYFRQSEQVPTLIRVGIRDTGQDSGQDSGHGCIAGGLLVQYLPEGEEGKERLHVRDDDPEWEHVRVLTGSVRHEELVDQTLSLDALIWRLLHEEQEIRVYPGLVLSRGCRCTQDHFRTVLSRFPPDELEDMRDEDGTIPVDCAFCSRIHPIEI